MTGIEFALVALAGVLLGRFLPNRRKGPEPVQPICGCGHHHSYHDPQAGRCGYAADRYVGEDAAGISQYVNRNCLCLQYSGPQPLPEVYAPEITGS